MLPLFLPVFHHWRMALDTLGHMSAATFAKQRQAQVCRLVMASLTCSYACPVPACVSPLAYGPGHSGPHVSSDVRQAEASTGVLSGYGFPDLSSCFPCLCLRPVAHESGHPAHKLSATFIQRWQAQVHCRAVGFRPTDGSLASTAGQLMAVSHGRPLALPR